MKENNQKPFIYPIVLLLFSVLMFFIERADQQSELNLVFYLFAFTWSALVARCSTLLASIRAMSSRLPTHPMTAHMGASN